MKVHTRLSAALLVVSAVFIAGIMALHIQNNRQAEALLQLKINEKNTLFDKILKLEDSSLETFVYDYSRSADLSRFMQAGTGQDIGQNVLPLIESFNVHGVWIFRTDMTLQFSSFPRAPDPAFPIDTSDLKKELSQRPFHSFFTPTERGYLQIIAAPIQPPQDADRISVPLGYLFAGRLWDADYLDELSALTESSLRVEPLSGQSRQSELEPWVISFTRPLTGWDKSFIAQIVVTSPSPLIKEFRDAGSMQLLLVLLFSATILIVLFVFSRRILQRPLMLISKSLITDDPAVLEPLQKSDTEFGKIAGLIVSFFKQKIDLTREIAERLKTEEALQRFRFMVENTGQEIYLVNPDGSLEYVNKAAAASLGYTVQEMLALGVSGFDSDFGPNFRQHFEILKTTDLPPFSTAHIAKDGRRLVKEFKSSYLRIGDREYVCGIGQDITDRLRGQEEIRSSRDLLENIFKTSPDIIISINNAGEIIAVNDAVAALTGYTAAEVTGQSLALFLPERDEDRQAVRSMVVSFYEDGFLKGREITWRRKDGSTVYLECNGTAIRDEHNEIAGAVCIIRDISDRKKIEEQLRQTQKMEAIGTLSGGIAHDFNNILGAIIGYTELAQDTAAPDSQTSQALSQVLLASNRAKELVRQILTFSRKTDSVRKPVQMHAIMLEAMKLLRASIPSNIEIRPIIKPCSDTVFADPTQMHQILMNLCTNAAQAMQENGGTLELRLLRLQLDRSDSPAYGDLPPGDYIRLTIQDTGCGIPRENLSRIFDPFFTTKQVGRGTGMGLAVVHGIVKSHGGTIQVYSEPGAGTSFHILLPAIDAQPADGSPEKPLPPIPQGTESILLVDDEPQLLDLGQSMLRSLGYRVTALQSSPAALEQFRRSPEQFDLILTDQTMPAITGDNLARICLEIRPDIPIILSTGYSKKISAEQANRIGIRAFLVKPITRRDLAEIIRQVLDSRSASPKISQL